MNPAATLAPAAEARGRLAAALWEAAAVAAITAVAAGLRFASLDLAPPGLYHDEAIYGILGLYVMHGNHALFFGEREALFMYLLAEGVKRLGHDVVTIRVVAALVGTATVPALYWLGRLLCGRRVGLLAAAGLAASYWHVTLSRDVFRADTLPLLATLALALLWAALRQPRVWTRLPLFLIAGGGLGLVLYTYIAGRIVPIVVLIFLVGEVLWQRRRLAPVWATLPLYFFAAALVFAPLGAFYLANPENFLGRMSEVSLAAQARGEGALSYLDNALRVAGMFLVSGDQNWRHNLAGKPVFGPLFGLAFLLGTAVCLRCWRRSESRFLLLWTALMLVPTVAAEDAPHYLRAIGALPGVYLLAAVGWETAFGWARTVTIFRGVWGRRFAAPAGFAALLGALLLAPAVLTAWTYFSLWLPRPETYAAFNGRLAAAGRYLATSPEWRASAMGKADFYLTRRFWQDNASMLWYLWPYLAGKERNLAESRLGSPWFDEDTALPLRGEGGHYLVSNGDAWAAQELRRLHGPTGLLTVDEPPPAPGGTPPFLVLHTGSIPLPAGSPTPLASFGGALTLQDYSLPSATPSGGEIEMVTTWRLSEPPSAWRAGGEKMTVFVHLLDADGSLLTAAGGLGYAPVDWRPGQSLLLRHTLRLPPGTAPGRYQVLLGLIGPDGQRVEETAARRPDKTALLPEPVVVTSETAPATLPRPALAARWPVEGRLSLLGLDLPGTEVIAGQSLRATIYWRAETDVGVDYDLPLVLLDNAGKEVARGEGQTAFGRYPTAAWQAGEVVRDPRGLLVGARVRAGTYTLALAGTNRQTGASLEPLTVAEVTVKEPARSYVPPQMEKTLPAPARFGDLAELIGYDADSSRSVPGGQLRFSLYWRATGESERRYKVFVHLLSPDGKVVAQSDAEPAGGARPLSTWVQGEIVTDGHTVALPNTMASGEYAVEVGLYNESDGSRLSLLDAGGRAVDTKVMLEPVAVGK